MRERLQVKVDLELHTISCPGVWLCPSGYVEVTIKSLGYFFKSGPMEPKFPLIARELFVLEGYYKSITTLYDLEKALAAEPIEITLWQTGRRLACYRGCLGRILQSVASHTDCVHVVRLGNCIEQQVVTQLLMTPSRSFPGVLAPKIEISGRATVRSSNRFQYFCHRGHSELILTCQQSEKDRVPHEDRHTKLGGFRRQQPVCHSNKLLKKNSIGCPYTDKQQFEYNDRDPVCIFANRLRYQSASESTSRNSSDFNIDGLHQNQSRLQYSNDHYNVPDVHSQTCSICQSYKSVFTSKEYV